MSMVAKGRQLGLELALGLLALLLALLLVLRLLALRALPSGGERETPHSHLTP